MSSEHIFTIHDISLADLAALSHALRQTQCHPRLAPLLRELTDVLRDVELSPGSEKYVNTSLFPLRANLSHKSIENLGRLPVPSLHALHSQLPTPAQSHATSPCAAATGVSQPRSNLRLQLHPYQSPSTCVPSHAASLISATADEGQPGWSLFHQSHGSQLMSPSSACTPSDAAIPVAAGAYDRLPQRSLRSRFHPYQPISPSPSCPSPSLSTTTSTDEDTDMDVPESSRSQDRAQGHEANVVMRGHGKCRLRGAGPPRRKKKASQHGQKTFRWGQEPGVLMSDAATSFIGVVATARWDSENYDVESWIQQVSDGFVEEQGLLDSEEDADSLSSLVERCNLTQAAGLRASFFNMVSLIKLAAKCNWCVVSFDLFQANFHCYSIMSGNELKTVTAIWKSEFEGRPGAPKDQTFRMWYASGCKYAAVAAGGSIYLLVLVAGLELKSKLSQVPGDTPWEIADILRAPPLGRSSQSS